MILHFQHHSSVLTEQFVRKKSYNTGNDQKDESVSERGACARSCEYREEENQVRVSFQCIQFSGIVPFKEQDNS